MGFEMILPLQTEDAVLKERIEIHIILADIAKAIGDKIGEERHLVMVEGLKNSLLKLQNVA
jgi:hypothetical protein